MPAVIGLASDQVDGTVFLSCPPDNAACPTVVSTNDPRLNHATGNLSSETPQGSLNGTNPTFSLSYTPVSRSLQVFVNGILQVVGYTLSGSTITFDSDAIPQASDSVYAVYQY